MDPVLAPRLVGAAEVSEEAPHCGCVTLEKRGQRAAGVGVARSLDRLEELGVGPVLEVHLPIQAAERRGAATILETSAARRHGVAAVAHRRSSSVAIPRTTFVLGPGAEHVARMSTNDLGPQPDDLSLLPAWHRGALPIADMAALHALSESASVTRKLVATIEG